MVLFNEKNEKLNIEDVKAELQNLDDVAVPTETEVKAALGDYFNQAHNLQAARLQFTAALAPAGTAVTASFLGGIGSKILAEIRKIICAVVGDGSTKDQILDAILSALSAIIPGGILIATIAKMVAKFIFSQGIGAFCAVPA